MLNGSFLSQFIQKEEKLMKKALPSALLCLSLAAFAAAQETAGKSFVIPRVETASTWYKLDGLLNDKVWEKADLIPDFTAATFSGKTPSKTVMNQTSVKIFYAEHIVILKNITKE